MAKTVFWKNTPGHLESLPSPMAPQMTVPSLTHLQAHPCPQDP